MINIALLSFPFGSALLRVAALAFIPFWERELGSLHDGRIPSRSARLLALAMGVSGRAGTWKTNGSPQLSGPTAEFCPADGTGFLTAHSLMAGFAPRPAFKQNADFWHELFASGSEAKGNAALSEWAQRYLGHPNPGIGPTAPTDILPSQPCDFVLTDRPDLVRRPTPFISAAGRPST
jgi:hypothetical protein